MSDEERMDGGEEDGVDETKIRVSLVLAKSIRHDRSSLELPSEPMAGE